MNKPVGFDITNVELFPDSSIKIDLVFWGLTPEGLKVTFSSNQMVFKNEWSEHIAGHIRDLVKPQMIEIFTPFLSLADEDQVRDLWTFVFQNWKHGMEDLDISP